MTAVRDVIVDDQPHRITTPHPITRDQAVALVRVVEDYHRHAEEPAARRLTRDQQRAVLDEQDGVYWTALRERYDPKAVATERKAA